MQRYAIVAENHRLIGELEKSARMDGLTQLYNRRAFFEVFERDLARAARRNKVGSCVMIDVDHFKNVNDNFGHLAGDQALIKLAKCLQVAGRDSDAVGRYGGEEFCVVLPDTDLDGGLIWAERCRECIEQIPFVWDGQPVPLSASFGVAEWHPADRDVVVIVNRADQALLDAKSSGGIEWSLRKTAPNRCRTREPQSIRAYYSSGIGRPCSVTMGIGRPREFVQEAARSTPKCRNVVAARS